MAQPQPGIKKMKQGMPYTCKEKTIILNVFKYFKQEIPDICVTEVVRRTARATGCSEKSVFQFRKEETSAGGFREPSKTKVRRNININSRDIKYDGSIRQAIREIIYDLKYRNIVPSLSIIRKQINSNESLPKFSLMTLRRLLFDMGFCYEKNGNKSVLVEKHTIENKDRRSSQKSNSSKKPICDNKIITGINSSNSLVTSMTNTSPISTANISNDNKPHKVQMQVTQSNISNVSSNLQNSGLTLNGNIHETHRLQMYARHPNNMNGIPTTHTIHHNVPIMRNDVITYHSNTIQMRSNLTVPVKCEMLPWMNPPSPYSK